MMMLSLSTPAIVAIISVIAVQYGLATFCLLKLAYVDIPKKQYVLWNLFILLVFFIGDAVFLVYYFRVGRKNLVQPYVPPESPADKIEGEPAAETADSEKPEEPDEIFPEAGEDKGDI